MDEEKVARWLKKLDETFQGPEGVIGERLLKLFEHEGNVKKQLEKELHGHDVRMTCLQTFCLDSFDEVVRRSPETWTQDSALYFGLHVPMFWRIRSSYELYIRGYFIDSLSLLRGIFESAVQLAALKARVISIDDVFGNLKTSDLDGMSDDVINKHIRKSIQKADKIIMKWLIWENSQLSDENKESLRGYLQILNHSVHKSRFALTHYFVPWTKGERTLPITPFYEEDMADFCSSYTSWTAWLVLKTIPLLQVSDGEFSEVWRHKYEILSDSWFEAESSHHSTVAKAFLALIGSRFD